MFVLRSNIKIGGYTFDRVNDVRITRSVNSTSAKAVVKVPVTAVYFAKEAVELEIINDINGNLIAFYEAMKNHPRALVDRVKTTLHSRKQHALAWHIYSSPQEYSDIDRAWAVWVLCSQGFASKIGSTWGYDKSRRTMSKRIQNAKARFDLELCARLERTTIECKDAVDVIARYDSPDAFHYVDPPYFNSDCAHYSGYTEDDFRKLLDVLSGVKGRFLLSSYPSDLLADYTRRCGWYQKEINQKVSVNVKAGTGKTKVEVLTANYSI